MVVPAPAVTVAGRPGVMVTPVRWAVVSAKELTGGVGAGRQDERGPVVCLATGSDPVTGGVRPVGDGDDIGGAGRGGGPHVLDGDLLGPVLVGVPGERNVSGELGGRGLTRGVG